MRKSQDLMVSTSVPEIIHELGKRDYYLAKKQRARNTVINITATLDIETTNTETEGFIYSIALCIAGKCVSLRYVDDLIALLDSLIDNFRLNAHRYLIIHVHNLGYEHMYLTQIIRDAYGEPEILLTKSRKPLYIRFKNGIEFRDSLKLLQKSLAKATEGLPHKKMVGDLDYKTYRTPDTPLSPDEFNYIVNDVRGLGEAIERLKWQRGYNAATLPLTNTAIVVEEVNKYCRKDPKCIKAIEQLMLDKEQLSLAYHCMAGGDTHGTRWKAGKVCVNCNSRDLKSAHPSEQVLEKFPAGRPITLPAETSISDLNELTFNGDYGWIALLYIYDFAIRPECPNPTISISKCAQIINRYGEDNGRLLGAEGALVYMDSNDYRRFADAYTYDESEVKAVKAVAFALDYLPDAYRQAILDKFIIKENSDNRDDRNFAKVCVNTIFGASAQKTIRDEYNLPDTGLLDAERTSWEENLAGKSEEDVNKSQKLKFPFLWGLWTSSLTRLKLWQLQKIVGWDKLIYWDTDSVKYEGEDVIAVDDKFNKAIIARCVDRGAVIINKKGKRVYIGTAENEYPSVRYGYRKFIFLHAKCYAAEAWHGEEYSIETTIAGVGKTEGIAAMAGDISNLRDGLYIDKAGGKKLIYHDEPVQVRNDFKRPLKTASWIQMQDRDYRVQWSRDDKIEQVIN